MFHALRQGRKPLQQRGPRDKTRLLCVVLLVRMIMGFASCRRLMSSTVYQALNIGIPHCWTIFRLPNERYEILDSDILSGWSDTREVTQLCSCRRDPYDYPVALGDDVLDLLVPVGEISSMAKNGTLDAIESGPLDSTNKVTDEVGEYNSSATVRFPLLHSSASERRTTALFADNVCPASLSSPEGRR